MSGSLRLATIVLAGLITLIPVSHASEEVVRPDSHSFVVEVGHGVYLEDPSGGRYYFRVSSLYDERFLYIDFLKHFKMWKDGDFAYLYGEICKISLSHVMNSGLVKGGSFNFQCQAPAGNESSRLPREKEPLISPREVLVGVVVSLLAAAVVYSSKQISRRFSEWSKRHAKGGNEYTCCWSYLAS